MDVLEQAGIDVQVLDANGNVVTGLNQFTKENSIRFVHRASGTPVQLSKEVLGNQIQTQAAPVTTTNVNGTAQTFASLVLPANSLKVGDKLRIRGNMVGVTRTSTDTVSLSLAVGSTTLFTFDTAFAHANTNWLSFDCELIVTAVGASGSVQGMGLVATGTAGATVKGVNVGATALDTTVDETFAIKGTFSASNTTDQASVNIFDLDVIRSNS